MATTKNCFINLISLLVAVGPYSSLVTAIDTIRAGDQLNSSSYLVSAGGNFTLGFFSLQDLDNCYLGIWYSNDDTAQKIWVANPNKPISNNSVALTITTNGELMITSNGGDSLVLNSNKGSGQVNATLEDSGNLVVNDETEQRDLWQSFDHPTNTLLPGMKLGFNLKTGQNWTLTSWLTSEVPASGAFTLSWDPTQESGGQLVIRRRGEIYWTSGALQNQSYFEYMPLLNSPFSEYRYNLSYVSNEDEKFFNFSVTNQDIKRWTLLESGQIVDGGSHGYLQPNEFCYGYESDSESGCANVALPKCRSRNDKFDERSAYFVVQPSSDENSSLSMSDCWAKCWDDCDCVGFTIGNSNGTGCSMWRGNLKFQQDLSGAAVRIHVLISPNSTKGNWWIWILIAIVISLIFLLLGFLYYQRKRKLALEGDELKRQEAYLLELTTSDGFNNENEVDNDENGGRDLKIFSFACIVEATDNFSFENKLGQGGFGPVFKGKLQEGREIAIKRLSKTSGQGLVEFTTELRLIAKLQHMNLVRILGCCIHGEEKMLIYEYMPNKSLDSYLFDPTKRDLLDWKKRFNIIEGVAQGLLYLHRYSRLRVIHRDLKASNILLDGNMNPKISDFGLARIFGQNESERNTNRVVGTYGYMSPEYAMEGNFSVKSDVFSFGVLILEIVSGKKNTSFYHLDRPFNLIGYAWELWKEGVALELMDPTLGDSCPTHQLLRIIQLGLLCVQESAMDRPTMSDVTGILSNETMPLPVPKQPPLFTGRRSSVVEVNSNEGNSKDCSANSITISTMEAR